MVLGQRFDGGTQALPARVRKTIQSIKEVVGNYSDADIYSALKETNMEPNETAQKLLNQDPFHEVKRRRERKKENAGGTNMIEQRSYARTRQLVRSYNSSWDPNARRGNFYKNVTCGISQEFRIVRDYRTKASPDLRPQSTGHSDLPRDQIVGVDATGRRVSDQDLVSENLVGIGGAGQSAKCDLCTTVGQGPVGEKKRVVSNLNIPALAQKLPNCAPYVVTAATASAVGVYSKSTDPVHVPSPDSRSAGKVGAIKREVGVVGIRSQSVQIPAYSSSSPASLVSTTSWRKDGSISTQAHAQSSFGVTKGAQLAHASLTRSSVSNIPVSRPETGNQQNNKLHQYASSYQKGVQSNMEWKPKSHKSGTDPGSTHRTVSPVPTSDSISLDANVGTSHLEEKLSQMNISNSPSVIIPQRLRVVEADRPRLTFGSFGVGFDANSLSTPSQVDNFTPAASEQGGSEQPKTEAFTSTSLSNIIASGDEASLAEEKVGTPESQPLSTDGVLEHPQPEDTKSSLDITDSCRNIGIVVNQNPSDGSSFSRLEHGHMSLPTVPEYYSHIGYASPFLRLATDENVHGHGLALSHEAVNSHVVSVPSSATPVVQQQQQQQQQPLHQLYPQVHISHYPNFMPCRQILSPVYAPPLAVPNYSTNTGYPHPSNGNNFVLMPGGGSHLSTGNLKYVSSQFKPVAAAMGPSFGNYNAAAYAMGSPGSMGGATCLEDVSRTKYKDGNVFVPNPQGEGSEIWVHTPRELSSMPAAAPYYNLPGQAAHATYVPSPIAPASYNTPAQPTHVAFSSLYPPQQASITNPHHLMHQQLPNLSGNIGGGGSGTQVGPYLQPPLGPVNWTANF